MISILKFLAVTVFGVVAESLGRASHSTKRALAGLAIAAAVIMPVYALRSCHAGKTLYPSQWPLQTLEGKIVAVNPVFQDTEAMTIDVDNSSIKVVNGKYGTTNTFYALCLDEQDNPVISGTEMSAEGRQKIGRFYDDAQRSPSLRQRFRLQAKFPPTGQVSEDTRFPFILEHSSYSRIPKNNY